MGHQFRGATPHNKGKGKSVVLNPCKCGCGGLCRYNFIRGHGARVNHWINSDKANKIINILSKSVSSRTGELSPRMERQRKLIQVFLIVGERRELFQE